MTSVSRMLVALCMAVAGQAGADDFLVRRLEEPRLSDATLVEVIQQVCNAIDRRDVTRLVGLSAERVLIGGGHRATSREFGERLRAREPEFWQHAQVSCQAGFVGGSGGYVEAPFAFVEGRAEVTREAFVVSPSVVYAEPYLASIRLGTVARGVVALAMAEDEVRSLVKADPSESFVPIVSKQMQVGYLRRDDLAYDVVVIQLGLTRNGWRIAQMRYD